MFTSNLAFKRQTCKSSKLLSNNDSNTCTDNARKKRHKKRNNGILKKESMYTFSLWYKDVI